MAPEEKSYQIIAVDFDGTLCVDCYPDIGTPNLPLIFLLNTFRQFLINVICY